MLDILNTCITIASQDLRIIQRSNALTSHSHYSHLPTLNINFRIIINKKKLCSFAECHVTSVSLSQLLTPTVVQLGRRRPIIFQLHLLLKTYRTQHPAQLLLTICVAPMTPATRMSIPHMTFVCIHTICGKYVASMHVRTNSIYEYTCSPIVLRLYNIHNLSSSQRLACIVHTMFASHICTIHTPSDEHRTARGQHICVRCILCGRAYKHPTHLTLIE